MKENNTSKYKPHHFLAITLAYIIAIESLLMIFVIPRLPDMGLYASAVVDSLLVGLLVFPVLHYSIFSPLIRDIKKRREAEDSLKVSNAELLKAMDELQEKSRASALLAEMDDLLQSSSDFEEAYGIIGRSSTALLPGSSGSLMILSPSRNFSETSVNWGGREPACRPEACNPEECWTLRRGQVNILKQDKTGFPCKSLLSAGKGDYLCVPLQAHGEALGVYFLQFESDRLTESKRQLALTASKQVALALANLKLTEALRVQSVRDPLTGLFNRRYMGVTLERELHRAARRQNPLGLVMIDLDHFKHFNDTFGHDAGDSVLRELGVFLKNQTRKEDVVCRYGGEEFLIILPDASLEMSGKRAEKIRDEVKYLNLRHNGQALGPVSLSMGVAAYPENGLSPDGLIEAADKALYSAKTNGRDMVIVANAGQA
ncbi:MAG: hypothetical protein A2X93_03950 [Deltaproteobacteria bacterium GWC2_56_8]|nr:MAG: hypothetical protein A2X99_05390 [Deltaproteobacteria bacterium GWB2_55_19]OGP38994.1 MAG: hypothetical protein A2X93_03950 [Deltaproteobacteria bacterium GWC2_56_8]HAO93587.1 GGDEF domain-containing protein [Deltaproteobacteria bacterium]